MNASAKLSRRAGIVLAAALISACAQIPGMQVSGDARDRAIDPNAPDATPEITQITPTLVRQQGEQAAAQRTEILQHYAALAATPSAYRVGPNDVLSITIWDHPELIAPNLTYTVGPSGITLPTQAGSAPPLSGYMVSASGEIQLPYAGLVQVAGKTEIEIQSIVTQRLTPFIKRPQVTVRVGAYLSQRVYLAGEVKQAGMVPITGVPMTLPAALAAAGGAAETGDESRIVLSRAGRSYTLSLPEMVANDINPGSVLLRNDDIVRVLPRENFKVTVAGEVLQPRSVPMRNDGRLTLSEALGESGGVRGDTAAPNAIYIMRAGNRAESPQIFRLDSKSPFALALAERFDLQARDVVYVDTTGLVRWNRLISLLLPSVNSVYTGTRIGGVR